MTPTQTITIDYLNVSIMIEVNQKHKNLYTAIFTKKINGEKFYIPDFDNIENANKYDLLINCKIMLEKNYGKTQAVDMEISDIYNAGDIAKAMGISTISSR